MRLSAVGLFTGVCLLWLAGCAASRVQTPGEYRISGSLEGVGGGRLSEAGVFLSPWGEPVLQSLLRVPATAEGRFAIVAPGPGDYTLWLTAPGYPAQALYLQLLADSPDLVVKARLEPYYYREPFEAPSVIGSWNDANWRQADAMRPQPDGTWVLDRAVEDESVTYQFQGLTPEDRGVSCYPGEGYLPDTRGTYVCRATPRAGRVHLLLDPRQLPRTHAMTPLRATFSGAYAFLEPINALHARTQSTRALASRAWRKLPDGSRALDFDLGTLPQELLATLRDARQPVSSRQLAVLDVIRLRSYFSLAKVYPGSEGEALAAEFLTVLPPDSPRWSMALFDVEALWRMMTPEGRRALAADFAERNPHPGVQAQGLAFQLEEAHTAQDTARMAELARRLEAHAPTQPVAFAALQKFMPDPEALAWKGKSVPDFSAPLMDTSERVSRESLHGRFYLLDFWATWCHPCVEEMAVLHAAAKKFQGRGGFTLLSVSMDVKEERLKDFRELHWKMPWMHVFNGPDFAGPAFAAFRIEDLPMTLLVDPHGVVVAEGEALRGEQLEKTLEALLPVTAR